MAIRQTFTAVRQTEPHWLSVLAILRTADPTVGFSDPLGLTVTIKKSTDWTPQQITQAQNVLDTAPADTPSLRAQFYIDDLPIPLKAILATVFDELNRRRQWDAGFKAAAAAATSLADLKARVALLPDAPDISIAQAIQAVRDKAGTL